MQDEMKGLHILGATIYTIVIGKAYSAAAEILAAGDERYATHNARLMMHPVSYDVGHDYISQQLAYSNFMNKVNRACLITAARNCGYKTKAAIKKFEEAIKDGLWMTADEAIDFGLIDNIWDYRWERDITGLE
jgi:ATP-dependent protease ClpP protease subunit